MSVQDCLHEEASSVSNSNFSPISRLYANRVGQPKPGKPSSPISSKHIEAVSDKVDDEVNVPILFHRPMRDARSKRLTHLRNNSSDSDSLDEDYSSLIPGHPIVYWSSSDYASDDDGYVPSLLSPNAIQSSSEGCTDEDSSSDDDVSSQEDFDGNL